MRISTASLHRVSRLCLDRPRTIGTALALLATIALAQPTATYAQDQPGGVLGSDPATIALSPETVSVACGETVEVEVAVRDAQQLWGVDFQLSFDPLLAQAADGDPAAAGIQLESLRFSEGADGMLAVNTIDNVSGVASFAAVLLRPAQPLEGVVTVARLRLRGIAEGSGEISFRSAMLADATARPIQSLWSTAALEVRCPATGPGSGDGERGADAADTVPPSEPTAESGSAGEVDEPAGDAQPRPGDIVVPTPRGIPAPPRGAGSDAGGVPTDPVSYEEGEVTPRAAGGDGASSGVASGAGEEDGAQSTGEGSAAAGDAGGSTAAGTEVGNVGASMEGDADGSSGAGEPVSGEESTSVDEKSDSEQMMLYLVIGMLAAVSSVVMGIAGGIAVARRMVPPVPKPDEDASEREER